MSIYLQVKIQEYGCPGGYWGTMDGRANETFSFQQQTVLPDRIASASPIPDMLPKLFWHVDLRVLHHCKWGTEAWGCCERCSPPAAASLPRPWAAGPPHSARPGAAPASTASHCHVSHRPASSLSSYTNTRLSKKQAQQGDFSLLCHLCEVDLKGHFQLWGIMERPG